MLGPLNFRNISCRGGEVVFAIGRSHLQFCRLLQSTLFSVLRFRTHSAADDCFCEPALGVAFRCRPLERSPAVAIINMTKEGSSTLCWIEEPRQYISIEHASES